MPKKETFLSENIIEHIKNNYKGKYSEYIREAVEDRYKREVEEKQTEIKENK